MSQSNLITPYPRQAGLLYDLQLRLLAQRRYIIMTSNSPQLISYLISVSTSISSTVWRFSPEGPIYILVNWTKGMEYLRELLPTSGVFSLARAEGSRTYLDRV